MYLLDTHTFFWFITGDEKLPENVRDIIETNENIYVSIVTFWEMAIKNSLGKMELPASISNMMDVCGKLRLYILPIKASHLDRLRELPFIHRDPFDRLLICQAQDEKLVLLTTDGNIAKYDVTIVWKN